MAFENGFEGKVSLITGGASGIGRATATRLVKERAQVLIADVDESRGKDVASEIGAEFLSILTSVDNVAINFGLENQKDLDDVSLAQIKKYHTDGHFPAGSMGPKVGAACTFVRQRLVEEYPEQFEWEPAGSGGTLRCALTEETLHFDGNMQLESVDAEGEGVAPPYASALDALACQVQADLSIVRGAASRDKLVQVDGLSEEELRARLDDSHWRS